MIKQGREKYDEYKKIIINWVIAYVNDVDVVDWGVLHDNIETKSTIYQSNKTL